MGRTYQPLSNRDQPMLLPPKIQDYVGKDSRVHAIDTYVDTLDLEKLGFNHTKDVPTVGHPPYSPWAMLKLYLYGYMKGIRSSRKLEEEARTNLEAIWLVQEMRPSYKSIADFRKDHVEQLPEVSRGFVLMCRELGMVAAECVAVDGSFLKADASKASIQTREYTEKALEKIDRKVEEYRQAIDRQDAAEENSGEEGSVKGLSENLEKWKHKQKEQQEIIARMEESGDSQVSTVDEDARLLRKRGQSVAGYNAQIAVDSKHNIVVNEDVTQEGNDAHQLSAMLTETKERLEVKELTGLADKGYYEGGELKKCEDENITAYVPVPDTSRGMKKKGRLSHDDFTYDAENDCYRCPQGKKLTPGKKPIQQKGKTYTQYSSRSADCEECPLRSKCLGKKSQVRRIQRWEHQEVIERHKQRMEGGKEKMKERSSIVEHPFGTVKVRNGLRQFLMRGLKKCRGEFSLMILAYNLTRVLNILGVEKFREYCAQRTANGSKAA